jgi:hypothetical protein
VSEAAVDHVLLLLPRAALDLGRGSGIIEGSAIVISRQDGPHRRRCVAVVAFLAMSVVDEAIARRSREMLNPS